jgi:hypothetical protein
MSGALLKPEGNGPFAAIVYSHGSEPDPSLEFLGELGRWFQKRGFVVRFPSVFLSGLSPFAVASSDESEAARRAPSRVEAPSLCSALRVPFQ